jgi:hypothetical protein
MSYLPPLGHFNFAQIGHYYFALTKLREAVAEKKNLNYNWFS